jgi:hypothetical protein
MHAGLSDTSASFTAGVRKSGIPRKAFLWRGAGTRGPWGDCGAKYRKKGVVEGVVSMKSTAFATSTSIW